MFVTLRTADVDYHARALRMCLKLLNSESFKFARSFSEFLDTLFRTCRSCSVSEKSVMEIYLRIIKLIEKIDKVIKKKKNHDTM